MSAEVNVLKQIVEPLTMMLSGSNVKVCFRGSEAMTLFDTATGKPTDIILPMISGDAPVTTISAYHGYLDHEVGHILFTDTTAVQDDLSNNLYMIFFNMVEDSRIEREMCKKYRGTHFNLERLYEMAFTEEKAKRIDGMSPSDPNALINACLLAIRAASGQEFFKKMVKHSSYASACFEDLAPLFGEKIKNASDSADAMAVAKEIVHYLGITINASKGADGSETKKVKTGQKSSEYAKGNTSADQKNSGKSKSEKFKGKESEDEGTDVHRLKKDAFEDETKGTLTNYAKADAGSSGYHVYTTDFDKIEYYETDIDHGDYCDIEQDVASKTSVIQKTFERAITARSAVLWQGGKLRGKLNCSSLAKLALGDARVFKKKTEAISKDVAVSLLIDCSGSMTRHISDAAMTAYAMATVLNRLGIAFEVLGFTTTDTVETVPMRAIYARYCGIYMPIFKSFNDKWDLRAKHRLATLILKGGRGHWMMGNVDGESVQICGNRLLSRNEKGKVMFVLSDGIPAADGDNYQLHMHLKKTVKELEKQVKIIALGFGNGDVPEFYSKYVILNKFEDLTEAIFKQVRKFLTEK